MTEKKIIARFGKGSLEHRQYLAVLREMDLEEAFGTNSPEHRAHKARMRALKIPVI